MTTVAMGNSSQLSVNVMRLLDQFRHDVFVKRLGWSLPMMNGVERDQYDTADAQYVVLADGSPDRVSACARLLPTTGSYMLPELFPQLLGSCAAPKDADVWELSRFATSVRETREGRVLSLSQPTLDLLDLVYDFARKLNIKRLVLVTSIGIERLMLRAGVPAHRVGPPAKVDGNLCVALFIEVPAKSAVEADSDDSSTLEPELEACV